MFLTGYHGTTKENAKGILNSAKFNISAGNGEWLGKGIYFYFDFSDAYEWRNTDVILHSVIMVEEDEYLGIETDTGKSVCIDKYDLGYKSTHSSNCIKFCI